MYSPSLPPVRQTGRARLGMKKERKPPRYGDFIPRRLPQADEASGRRIRLTEAVAAAPVQRRAPGASVRRMAPTPSRWRAAFVRRAGVPRKRNPGGGGCLSGMPVSGFRFLVSGSISRVPGFGIWVPGFRIRVSVLAFRVPGFGFRAPGFGLQVSGFGFHVSEFGFRVSGSGFWVMGFGLTCCVISVVKSLRVSRNAGTCGCTWGT